jgi:hypothetical protein
MLRIPHCLDNRLTDGGKVVSLVSLVRTLLPRNVIFLLLVHISVRGSVNPRTLMWLKILGKLKKFSSSRLERATFRLVA